MIVQKYKTNKTICKKNSTIIIARHITAATIVTGRIRIKISYSYSIIFLIKCRTFLNINLYEI